MKAALRALAKRLGVASRMEIRAVPPDDRARMADELSRVDVVVLASEFETHPIAVLEAASLGCRAVVADSPGLRELGERRARPRRERPGDSAELARAVLAEIGAPRLAKPVDLPSWDDCADRLCELYASVAG